jgi:Family of unknown function (DUF6049)
VTRRRGSVILVGLICASFVAPVIAPIVITPVRAAPGRVATDEGLQLISQNFNIPADGTLTATIALPADLAGSDLSTALFAITVEQRVEKREDLASIIDRALARRDDTVAISPVCCLSVEPNQYAFSVPLEIAEVRPDALSIPRAGLYPVTIAIQRGGRILATLLTFINRLPAADEQVDDPDPMSVALALGTHSTVHLDSKGTTSLDDASTIDEMTNLADTLDALNVSKFPATVRVAPEVVNGLQVLQPSLFSRLIGALQVHQVLAEPRWPLDPSAAAIAGQVSLYTSWLRDGQAKLTNLGLGPAVVTRSTIFADRPISDAGATLRYDQGAGLMVMTQAIYDGLDGSIGRFSQYRGELIDTELDNNSHLDSAVVDPTIAELLLHPMATPEQTRVYVLAELLALRQKLETEGAALQRHAVVVGTKDLGVPDAALIGSIAALVAATPGLRPATLDDVALRTDRLVAGGDEQPVTLPDIRDGALQERIFRKAKLNNEINAVASMLPDDNERPKGWLELSDLLPTTALDDLDAEAMDNTIRGELDEIRSAVQVPAAYTVNLTGRQSTVRIRLVNTSDTPLLVKVQLTSPPGKLVFVNDPLPVRLEPGVPTNIPIDVKALSNGTSGVTLDVSTPNDVAIGEPVPLQFRVNAIGVGNVLTLAVFGLVLLWWLLHWRSARRRRRQVAPATLLDS